MIKDGGPSGTYKCIDLVSKGMKPFPTEILNPPEDAMP